MKTWTTRRRRTITRCQSLLFSSATHYTKSQSNYHPTVTSMNNHHLPPLFGIRILDMSRVLAGPYATQLLADLGAQVIKIEPPGNGDDTREWGPPYHAHTEQSAYFMSANRNKHSVCIDLKSKHGPSLVQQLSGQCDVLIENFKVNGLRKFGLDFETIRNLYNEDIIYCSISGYGQNGPRKEEPGYDFVMQAKSGLMSITGPDNTINNNNNNNTCVADKNNSERNKKSSSSPYKVGTAVVDVMTGMYASTAILSAIIKRDRTNCKAQYIDLALYDVSLSLLANQSMNYLISGKSPTRLGNRHPSIVPYEMFETKNGQIVVAVGNDLQFRNFIHVLFSSSNEEEMQKRDMILNDVRFKTNKARVVNRIHLLQYIEPQLRLYDSIYWENKMLEKGVPCSRVNTTQEAFEEEQVKARNMVWNLEHEKSGSYAPFVGQPIHFSHPSVALDENAKFSPDLGQHTEQVLKEVINATDEQIKMWREAGTFGATK